MWRSAGGNPIRVTATSARSRRNANGAAALHERLCARRVEIEQAVLTRAYGISDPSEVRDPTYLEGLRAAVKAAIDYGLEGVQGSARNPPSIPPALLVQARVAARSGVGLDTVLRRYFAGYALFGDFLVEEAQQTIAATELKRLLRAQATLFERLLAAVSEEHRREEPDGVSTFERRKLELVQGLLLGEPLDAAELAYDLQSRHVALFLRGPGGAEALKAAAAGGGHRLLTVRAEEETVWGWLGGRDRFDPEKLKRLIESALPAGSRAAFGEPGQGPGGWRLSHRQARAALAVGARTRERVVRYVDVALLAALGQDELLSTSLRQLYLEPLRGERDRETVRAYFSSARNMTSTAAVLGLSRQAVAARLRGIEERIGRPIEACATEMELAIRMDRGRQG